MNTKSLPINLRSRIWLLFVPLFLTGLAACSIDNNLVLEFKESSINILYIKGIEIIFPNESEVNFIPLPGSSWVISGDIATIEKDVVAGFNAATPVSFPNIEDSQIQVENITIKYSDSITDGSDTHPSLALSLLVKTTKSGIILETCHVPAVFSELDKPVTHGLFAGREKMRRMILPAYEELISKALTEALVIGFKCLSEKNKPPS